MMFPLEPVGLRIAVARATHIEVSYPNRPIEGLAYVFAYVFMDSMVGGSILQALGGSG